MSCYNAFIPPHELGGLSATLMVKDIRNKKVSLWSEEPVERDLFCTDAPKLPEYSFHIELSGALKMTPEAENWFKNMKAKALLETWRKLKGSNNEK